MPKKLSLLVLIAFTCVGFSCSPEHLKGSENRTFGLARRLCDVTDPSVRESSGIAASRIANDTYYTHNDSGDSARFFRFDKPGKLTGTFAVPGAKAVDWEEMAVQEFDGHSFVFLADIGDNAGKRKSIQIYRVPEPVKNAPSEVVSYDLAYPDEPHNAEAFFVDPSGGFTIITKAANHPAQVFYLPKPDSAAQNKLVEIGKLEIASPLKEARKVTGAAISPDGKHILVRTYLTAYEYPVTKTFIEWLHQSPLQVDLAPEIQGEGICYSRIGDAILTTSEGSPCPVDILTISHN